MMEEVLLSRADILLITLGFVFYVHYTLFAWYLTSLMVGVGMDPTYAGVNYVILLLGYVAIAPPLSFVAEKNKSLGRRLISASCVLASFGMYFFLRKDFNNKRVQFFWSVFATVGITSSYATSASMLSTCALDAIKFNFVRLSWGTVRAAMNFGGASAGLVVLISASLVQGPLSWNRPASLTPAISCSVAAIATALALFSFILTLALETSLDKKKNILYRATTTTTTTRRRQSTTRRITKEFIIKTID
uniref:Uncharacterized protein n=1 Tax=Aureoumbra lagunensis TaxID=44058 RepID=A0A7S3JWA6_9STRA